MIDFLTQMGLFLVIAPFMWYGLIGVGLAFDWVLYRFF